MDPIKEPDGPFYIFSKPLTPEERAELVEYIANYKREEAAKQANKSRTTTANGKRELIGSQSK